MLRVYGFNESGNCYKVKLLLKQLCRQFEWVNIDILKKENRTPDFLAKNPHGKVPLLEIETGTFLWESNAILCYLSEGTNLLPNNRLEHAQTLQWLFFEQYSHAPNLAIARYITRYLGAASEYQQTLTAKRELGYVALDVMEKHLTTRQFFLGDRYTIADIALYAYTHVADEGGFDLTNYRFIKTWLELVRTQPNHITMNSLEQAFL